MSINSLRLCNFKSFEELAIELGSFNLLIGRNAAGKSNFLSVFSFLKDLATSNLDNAIARQGGVEYLRNLNIGSKRELRIAINATIEGKREFSFGIKDIGIGIKECDYEFTLRFKHRGGGYEIGEDKLKVECTFFKQVKGGPLNELGSGTIVIEVEKRRALARCKLDASVPLKEEDLLPKFIRPQRLPQRALLLDYPTPYFPFSFELNRKLRDIMTFDIDPRQPKRAVPIADEWKLAEDARNLSSVLLRILTTARAKQRLENLVKDTLPFIDGLRVESIGDKTVIFKLKEHFYKKTFLPASFVSDGTINITALIIVLFFSDSFLTIIEEPEKNIHPYLIAKIAHMIQEASKHKQIIVSTHNPEILRHSDLDDVLLVDREERGVTTITRVNDKAHVQAFLRESLGLSDLFIKDLI